MPNLTLEEIKIQARDSWGGQGGIDRMNSVENIILTRIENYSRVLGIPKEDILPALEKIRNVNTPNWYQQSNLPLLEDGVLIFDSLEHFKKKFPSHKSICPACGGVSTDYYSCNSGVKKEVTTGGGKKKKTVEVECDWKVFGLMGDLGKGVKVVIKDRFLEHPKPILIFKPIELEGK
jgi:hypothetical protein